MAHTKASMKLRGEYRLRHRRSSGASLPSRSGATPLSPTGWELTFDGKAVALPLDMKLEPALPIALFHYQEQSYVGTQVEQETYCKRSG
jgi:hypothetical protein